MAVMQVKVIFFCSDFGACLRNSNFFCCFSSYVGWHIKILSQHYVIIVDNDLQGYLWTFQSQGSAGIAQAKRIRRTPPGVVAWVDHLTKSLQKPSWAGILHSYWPRDGRRPSPRTGVVASFCCLLFFDRFLEGIFSIFVHVWPPLGTPKIIRNRQTSVSGGLLFPTLCFSCTFSWFWLILDAFGWSKSRFFHGTGNKICILAKNELWQSQDRF